MSAYEDDEEKDFDYDNEEKEFGCVDPENCIMPELHFPSECHTAKQMQEQYDEEKCNEIKQICMRMAELVMGEMPQDCLLNCKQLWEAFHLGQRYKELRSLWKQQQRNPKPL